LLPPVSVFTLETRTLSAGFVGDCNAYRSVWSVCTRRPGGVRPGASRWSAARAEGGPPLWRRRIARTIEPATAKSTAGPTVLLFTNLADVIPISLLSRAVDAACSQGGTFRFDGPNRTRATGESGRRPDDMRSER